VPDASDSLSDASDATPDTSDAMSDASDATSDISDVMSDRSDMTSDVSDTMPDSSDVTSDASDDGKEGRIGGGPSLLAGESIFKEQAIFSSASTQERGCGSIGGVSRRGKIL
jgi:hypothetical protein